MSARNASAAPSWLRPLFRPALVQGTVRSLWSLTLKIHSDVMIDLRAYLGLFGSVQWFFVVILATGVSVYSLRNADGSFKAKINRLLVFNIVLLFFGALGNWFWNFVSYGKLYVSSDRVLDWLPILPPVSPVSHYVWSPWQMVNGFELVHLNIVWFCILVPVWFFSWFTYRKFIKYSLLGKSCCAVLAVLFALLLWNIPWRVLGVCNALLLGLSAVCLLTPDRGHPESAD